SDARNGKTTYVSLAGLDGAKSDVKIISDRAMAGLSSLRGSDTESGRFLTDLISGLVNREK
ncbi:MAG: polyprenyl synthetase family protein, partial [Lachnospiraceae bacterium]|nr:polyprenyl synthetase family protein [Lachnospiraceae bacterium]